jgi:type 1 glutamine amidotransferase
MRFIHFAISLALLLLGDAITAETNSKGPMVLFAQNHGEYYNLEGEGLSLQRFTSILVDQGVEVSSLRRGEIDRESLEDVDVLILSYPMLNLSHREIKALQVYVASGGGLLVLGGQLSREYVNPVLVQFGMEMGSDIIQRNGELNLRLRAGTHEIFTYVNEFEYLHAPAVRVSDPAWVVYRGPLTREKWALFAYRKYGVGRVFVSGDADFANDFFIDNLDNAQLAYNMVLYTGGLSPVKLEKSDHSTSTLILVSLAALALLFLIKVLM